MTTHHRVSNAGAHKAAHDTAKQQPSNKTHHMDVDNQRIWRREEPQLEPSCRASSVRGQLWSWQIVLFTGPRRVVLGNYRVALDHQIRHVTQRPRTVECRLATKALENTFYCESVSLQTALGLDQFVGLVMHLNGSQGGATVSHRTAQPLSSQRGSRS